MLQITLYRNCFLNNRYSTVFDTNKMFWLNKGNPFERYLATLSSIERTLPSTYMTESGELQIDVHESVKDKFYEIYDFNYMKMVDTETEEVRYYFINNVRLGNSIAVLEYNIDIWHSYSDKMKLRNGILGQARLNTGALKRALPIAYTTNKALTFNGANAGFYLVAQIAEYKVTEATDEAQERYVTTNLIGYYDYQEKVREDIDVGVTSLNTALKYHFNSAAEAQAIINRLTAYQGMKSNNGMTYSYINAPYSDTLAPINNRYVKFSDRLTNPNLSSTDKNNYVYEIEQIYAVPVDMIDPSQIWYINQNNTARMRLKIIGAALKKRESDNLDYVTCQCNEIGLCALSPNFSGVYEKSYGITRNETTVGYGLRSLLIPDSYDNKYHEVNFVTTVTDLGMSIGLMTNQGYTDLDSQFEVPLPFTTLSGVERQQAAIAKQQAKMQRTAAIASLVASVAIPVATLGIGAIKAGTAASRAYITTQAQENAAVGLGSSWREAKQTAKWSGMLPGFDTKAALSSANLSVLPQLGLAGIVGTQSIISAQNTVKSPLNLTGASNTEPNALLNAMIGFGYYTIEPNNEAEVQDAIDKIGYTVYLPTDDYHHGLTSAMANAGAYDVIQFLNVEVYGPFSQTIARALEEILTAGFKIHYTEEQP